MINVALWLCALVLFVCALSILADERAARRRRRDREAYRRALRNEAFLKSLRRQVDPS